MNIFDHIFLRSVSHANSERKIIDRTKDDNNEASEYTSNKFKLRKGKNIINQNDDIFPCMTGKKPVKPKDGTRKFKGAETIRKMKDEI